jgi:hypothetical protein
MIAGDINIRINTLLKGYTLTGRRKAQNEYKSLLFIYPASGSINGSPQVLLSFGKRSKIVQD